MTNGLQTLGELTKAHGPVVRVTVIRADGSAPCAVGSAMTLTSIDFHGTIGGGALELAALDAAREILGRADGEGWYRKVRDFPLGPALGQCCGGHVRLLFERVGRPEAATLEEIGHALAVRPIASAAPLAIVAERHSDHGDWPLTVRRAVRDMLSGAKPCAATLVDGWFIEPTSEKRDVLFLYGAGHVGRAVVHAFAGLPFDIYWVDTDAKRYPDDIREGVHQLVSVNPADAARHAPADAWHVVMTFSHAIDFEICRTVLSQGGFAYLGVIASQTKRARFIKRLCDAGVHEDQTARLHAPIGLPGLEAKDPSEIAVSLAADILLRRQERAIVSVSGDTLVTQRAIPGPIQEASQETFPEAKQRGA